MKEVAQEIKRIVNYASEIFGSMSNDEVSFKEISDSWSNKEILGHLIDSAVNNHQRFVRACYSDVTNFPTYDQIEWVRIQKYNASDWVGLVELWSVYNRHLSEVIERIPIEAFSSPVNIGKDKPVTLEFVIKDYLRHLRHHIEEILDKQAYS